MSVTFFKDYEHQAEGYTENTYAVKSLNSSPIVVRKLPSGELAGIAGRSGIGGVFTRGVILRNILEGGDLHSRLVKIVQEELIEAGHQFGYLKAWYGYAGAFIRAYIAADANGNVYTNIYYYHPPTVDLPEGKMLEDAFFWGYLNGEFLQIKQAKKGEQPDPRLSDPNWNPYKVDSGRHVVEVRIDTDVVTYMIDDDIQIFDVPTVAEAQEFKSADVWHGNVPMFNCLIEVLEESDVPRRTPEELATVAALIKAGQLRRAELERLRQEEMRRKQLEARQAEAARIRAEQDAAREAKRKARANELRKARKAGE